MARTNLQSSGDDSRWNGFHCLYCGWPYPGGFARYFTGIGFHPGLRQTRLFFYGQDTWGATRKLTVSYGLRYENYLPQTAASRGGAGSFDPNTGEVLVAGVGSVPLNMGVRAYNLGFARRLC